MPYIRLLSLSLSFLLLNPFVNFFNHFFSKPDKITISYPEVILNSIENNYDLPTSSGQVTNLPWRNDMDFLKAKEKYDTPFLLAAYSAVLKNPLPGEGYNVALASNKMKGLVLEEGEVFSMNTSLGPYSKDNGYKEGASYSAGNIVMTEGRGVCKIAGVAYNLAVFSDLEIVERYNHSMPINYLPYGQDATAFYRVKDLKLKIPVQIVS